MSDLTATNCGCGNNSCGNNSCGNFIWIILLLCLCGGNDGGCGMMGGCGNNSNNNGCEWLIWILLLSCCGGNGGLFGNNNCGCGC